jgi:hypothetical protein
VLLRGKIFAVFQARKYAGHAVEPVPDLVDAAALARNRNILQIRMIVRGNVDET